jgi:UDP-N-acetylglucosamine 2-epimerase
MKSILVIGTRPQIIKSAPIINLAKNDKEIQLEIVHTGQHYDYEMSKQFFNELEIPDPIVNLNVGSGLQGWQTAEMLKGLETVFLSEKPDLIIVPGDTNSTLAAALAAVKLRIPIAHVESGARSFDMSMPEEINRILTDHCSKILFAVSSNCLNNLVKEGIDRERVYLVGDTMYESLLKHQAEIKNDQALRELGIKRGFYYVLTLHRQENVDDRIKLKNIFQGLSLENVLIVFPCHPRTKSRLIEAGIYDIIKKSEKIMLIEPVPYYRMLNLIKNARGTITDSGGVQKEAYWLGTPCITLRENTEWIETTINGTNILTGTDPHKIQKEIKKLTKKKRTYTSDLFIKNASFNILTKIKEIFN